MLTNLDIGNQMNNKIAIVALTRGYVDKVEYDVLIQRNKSISQKMVLNTGYEYDIILFHEGNITKEHQEYITEKSEISLIFRDVTQCGNYSAFDDTKNKINMELCPPTELSSRFNIGYKHMCHFWAIDIFDYLSDYKYVIRIDEDVIVKEFHPNIIDALTSNDIKFAVPFMCNFLDDPGVIVGMEKLFDNFCEENNFIPKTKFNNIYAPNTNFMILDLQYFKNNELIQKFLKKVDDSHGIYSNRWGDATTWGIIVYSLTDEPFYVLDMVEYYHGSHGHHVNKSRAQYV
jgi:hypothetical protein